MSLFYRGDRRNAMKKMEINHPVANQIMRMMTAAGEEWAHLVQGSDLSTHLIMLMRT